VSDSDAVSAALHEAARWGHERLIATLLDAGARCDRPDSELRTPLFIAASVGHADTVRALLQAGALAEGAGPARRSGWRPLHAAADRGHTAVVELLLAAGASPASRCATGRTPRDLAEAKLHRQALAALAAHEGQAAALLAARQRLAWATANRGSKLAPDLVQVVGEMLQAARGRQEEANRRASQPPDAAAAKARRRRAARLKLQPSARGPRRPSTDGGGRGSR